MGGKSSMRSFLQESVVWPEEQGLCSLDGCENWMCGWLWVTSQMIILIVGPVQVLLPANSNYACLES